MSKKIIIIGGGISGISAGIYAQKLGFESEIYEKHSIPGGECTGWDRKGFHIDGCIHWMTGSKDGTYMGGIWREIGALSSDVEIYQPEFFNITEFDGVTVKIYCDLMKLRNHLTEISPEDKAEIDILCDSIGKMKDAGIPNLPPDMMNPLDLLHLIRSMSGSMKVMNKFMMSLSDYVQRFHHPAIKQALLSILPVDNCAYVLPFVLGTICSGNGGRPAGGSRAMAFRMAEKYKAMGGIIHLKKEINEIKVVDGTATGIILADGTTVCADYILPTVDIHVTLDRLLGGKYPNAQINMRDADQATYPAPTCVYAAFGIDADISDGPNELSFQSSPYIFEDSERNIVSFKHYCYEPSFAPAGKSVGIVYLTANYEWWQKKHANINEYNIEKVRLASSLIVALEERFPHLKGKITSLDVATPMTYERYCGAWHGAWMSYSQTPRAKRMMLNGKIKGIKNLFMAGQWLMMPGGLPVAIITGKWAIQRICKNEKMSWRW